MMRSVSDFGIDLVYPRRCAGCGRRGTWLCGACDAELARFGEPLCATCGVPDSLDACQCASMPSALAKVRSIGSYAGWLREAVIRFKYEGEWGRVEHLGPALAEAMKDLEPCHALVPVPLHVRRYRQRGYNQSRLLADHAGSLLGIEVRDLLIRQRRTSPQARLGAAARASNVMGAFSLVADASVVGQDLVLIDDVITTGSTLAACAMVLHDAGANSVSVATLARELSALSHS